MVSTTVGNAADYDMTGESGYGTGEAVRQQWIQGGLQQCTLSAESDFGYFGKLSCGNLDYTLIIYLSEICSVCREPACFKLGK